MSSEILTVQYAPVYHPEWDDQPERYVESGIVRAARSRRLGRADAPVLRLKAYLGVQHFDPARWGITGKPQSRFFLSIFLSGRTISMRVYPTMDSARSDLEAFVTELQTRPSLS